MKKTNAMRILDRSKVDYEYREYQSPEDDDLGMRVADLVGMPYGQVFKTLVAESDTDVRVFVIPVDTELDLKKAALATGDKRLAMLHVRDLVATTGYERGGVSPIGLKKPYMVVVDQSALSEGRIAVSAGAKGLQVVLSPKDLQSATGAHFHDVTRR